MTSSPPPLYRLHVRPFGGEVVDYDAAWAHCLDQRVIGVGWQVYLDDEGQAPTWEEYERRTVADGGKVDPSVRMLHDLDDGSLVWTRDTRGKYFLSKVTGRWRYLVTEEGMRLDIANVRPADTVAVGVESRVPGPVVAGFRAPRTLNTVLDPTARWYSAHLWSELAGEPAPAWRPTMHEVLTSCLGATELEDLVAVYLQRRRGYLVMPGSRRADTMAYEYVLRHPSDGHEAIVQVKTGHEEAPEDADSLPVESVGKAFVFATSGRYRGEPAANVERLRADDLVQFMREEPRALPALVEQWASFARRRA